MKTHYFLFWLTLSSVFCLIHSSSDDDLLDFDFSETKDGNDDDVDVNLNYENDDEQQRRQMTKAQIKANEEAEALARKRLEDNMLDFAVEIEDDDEAANQVPPFDWREKVLRNALAKALTDRSLRQKFAEVMPILRLLSGQQRLALSALISAQMNAKQGHELRYDQVRMMFQDDKKLLLPIVYDLANLVKSSARKYIQFGNDMARSQLRKSSIDRKFDLNSEEEDEEKSATKDNDDEVGTIRVPAATTTKEEQEEELEDFFADMPEDVLDPQMINEELQSTMITTNQTKSSSANETSTKAHHRLRRATNEFIHKLIRSMPLSVNEDELMRGAAGRTIKLNTTVFLQPNQYTQSTLAGQTPTTASTSATSKTTTASIASATPSSTPGFSEPTLSYFEIEDLAFAGLNGTEIDLNPNERLDKVDGEEALPSPEELIAGPRYRLNGNKLHGNMRHKTPIKRKRIQQNRGRGPNGSVPPPLPQLPAASVNSPVVSPLKKCERFTASMCIRTDDYPLDQIMGSIRRHKNAMSALLAEFYDKPNNNLEFGDDFDDYVINTKRREDETTAGGMCQSIVRYARPQKARSASGEWKYIVNTGQHTQTLRLEKCSNPGEGCSYLAQTYRSHCSQVYNYHRLLSWDKVRGLHVDIFKVPTCCSCQVDGYRQQFPPLSSLQSKEFTPSRYQVDSQHNNNNNGYSTINEDDLDYNDESDEDELTYGHAPSYGHQHKKDQTHFDNNELFLSSKKVRTKVQAPPTVGAYLSPPDDEFREAEYAYKGHQRGSYASSSSSSSASPSSSSSSSHKKYYSHVSRRRPHNEPRVDLDLSPSESHVDKEVNIFGTLPLATDKSRVPQKRKRIYSAPHTVTAGGGRDGGISSSAGISGDIFQPQQQSTLSTTSTATNSATNAHQIQQSSAGAGIIYGVATTAAIPPVSSTNFGSRNYLGSFSTSKSRPRFYAPSASATTNTAQISSSSNSHSHSVGSSSATTSSSTESTYQQRNTRQPIQSTALPPPIYHVNSIYSNGNTFSNVTLPHTVRTSSHTSSGTAKRINYNYHPIIDFFEKNKHVGDSTEAQETDDSIEQVESKTHLYSRRITSAPTSVSPIGGLSAVVTNEDGAVAAAGDADNFYQQNLHERRIGFGAGGKIINNNGGLGHAAEPFADADNSWQPVAIDTK